MKYPTIKKLRENVRKSYLFIEWEIPLVCTIVCFWKYGMVKLACLTTSCCSFRLRPFLFYWN